VSILAWHARMDGLVCPFDLSGTKLKAWSMNHVEGSIDHGVG
jgi:hypothetical protein